MTPALTSASILMFALQVFNTLVCTHTHGHVYKVKKKKLTMIELCVFAAGVRFSSECVEEVQRQRQLLWDMAAFLLSNQIAAVVSLVWSNNIQIYHVQFKMISIIIINNKKCVCACVRVCVCERVRVCVIA